MKKNNSIKHLSIIMDGNKRWAENKNFPIKDAYSAGIENVLTISEKLIEKEIKYLSVYALSTENLKRPEKEVKYSFRGNSAGPFAVTPSWSIKNLELQQEQEATIELIESI